MAYVNFKLDTDADGIALVTWDAPGRSMNVIDLKVIEIEYSSGSAWTCAPTCQIQRFGQDNLGEKEISLKVRASPAQAAGHPDWIYLGRSHASPPRSTSGPER